MDKTGGGGAKQVLKKRKRRKRIIPLSLCSPKLLQQYKERRKRQRRQEQWQPAQMTTKTFSSNADVFATGEGELPTDVGRRCQAGQSSTMMTKSSTLATILTTKSTTLIFSHFDL